MILPYVCDIWIEHILQKFHCNAKNEPPYFAITNKKNGFLFQIFFIMCALKWIDMFQTHVVIIGWWILCGEDNKSFQIFQKFKV
jgi:hypothetical protein